MLAVKQGVTQQEIPKHHEEDPKNCTEWQIIDIPTVIVKQLQKRNQKYFGQAYGTPFTVSPISNVVQFTGKDPEQWTSCQELRMTQSFQTASNN